MDRQQMLQEEREKKPNDQRKVEALEQIADALGRIQGELAALRGGIPRPSSAGT